MPYLSALLSSLSLQPKAPEVQDEKLQVIVYGIKSLTWAVAVITPAILIGMTSNNGSPTKTSKKPRNKVVQQRKTTRKK